MAEAIEQNESATDVGSLEAILESVAELLPQQAPLHAFVHHNTLHAFEDLPFEDAVVRASRILGTEGFQSEAAFAEHLRTGRVRDRDLARVEFRDAHADDVPLFDEGPTERELRLLRLRNPIEIPTGATLRWHLEEGGARSRLRSDVRPERRRRIQREGDEPAVLARLWQAFESVAPDRKMEPAGLRWRDRLLTRTGVDADEWVHPLMIRLTAAFLDQGVAYWAMPDRDRGLLQAVRRLYGQRLGPPIPWAAGLAATFRDQQASSLCAADTVGWALASLGASPERWEDVIRETLLSLRGWAGMVRHLEVRPDRAPVRAPAASLMDYLALQLCLDLFAARHLALRDLGFEGALGDLGLEPEDRVSSRGADQALVYEAFALAQLSEVPLDRFQRPEVARAWIEALRAFDSNARRWAYHLAYEHRHRVEVLDALAACPGLASAPSPAPSFQAVFCIDDREESIRRHLEEIDPRVETFGYAGFFGVAMQYQGLADVRPRPLCPVVISPDRLVREVARESEAHESWTSARRREARLRYAAAVGARTLVRGGVLSSVLGPLSIIPLVGHALFPRLAHRLGERFANVGDAPPRTRLILEAEPQIDVEASLRIGYSVAEMADIVASAVETMGLGSAWSPLVVVVGHGSSSLNNPHEAAHDCGATGGGRGGPNARAFATMANHSGVRTLLRERGLEIPDTTHFVGVYHNTCDDSLVFYDLDQLPEGHHGISEAARARMTEACRLEAHERCRRFETAPLRIGLERAAEDVEEHAIDLAQPRPEYGHATNAICFVGRRGLTRGLFLDRRAFLVSYDPTTDPEGRQLGPLLLSVGPVGAGINLEYYFSYVDPTGYGCGTKLPHNITGLIGVMDGHASDLRPGLPWQMVEIHEPVRLLTIVDAQRTVLEDLLGKAPALDRLVRNGWIQLVCREPADGRLWHFRDGAFAAYVPERTRAPRFARSVDYYEGRRGHLAPVWIDGGRAA